jgi:hypothetical protein
MRNPFTMRLLYAGLLGVLVVAIVLTAGCAQTPEEAGENGVIPTDGTDGTGPNGQAEPTVEPTPDYVAEATPYATQTPVEPLHATSAKPQRGEDTSYLVEYYHDLLAFSWDNVIALDVELPAAPLRIDIVLYPKMIEDIKSGTSSYGTKEEYNITYTVPHPESRFIISVYNSDTQTLVLEDGFGISMGSDLEPSYMIRTPGNYHIEMTGRFMEADVALLGPPEVNGAATA